MTFILVAVFCGASISVWLATRAVRLALANGTRHLASEVEQSLADVFVFVNRQKAATATLSAMIVLPALVFALSGSVLVALASLPLVWFVPRQVLAWMRTRRIRMLERQLPDMLLMIAGALRAGASLPIALESGVQESAPPISQEFDLLLREIRLGIDLDIAMRNIEKRIPVPDFMMVTAAVTISREVGGNLAEALESVARTLRDKLQMEGKIRALTSQGRMQGVVMTCLPLFLMMVLRAMEPVAMAPLFTTPIGWETLAVIAVMEFLGYQSIARIVRINV
ncbi:type II secretion system F family protein [Paraburkholderia hospita]|uniref:Secretion system protein F n=1 Tax=Paraburkholderia hospita TaxID=169430 RepID=A0AAN1JF22_9BURK|nr:type II secretion system F family protein [Paraburkholderia hospita]AUT72741.1 secretion system protein F [Paraburkholderia hospita]EIN01581.1 type II secretion system protein [Paraburkholderia hospita]OUL81672.1 secretion system protein F [Paraburkholderia hospita]OUL83225.1 secretion system protein F [Paraburkholderia hospita]SEI25118.1 tight adherence protein B [Paraburkholderia hospita]